MLKEKVIQAIAKVKEIDESAIKPENTLVELQVDSLDAIEIMFELEEEYDLSIPTENLQKLETVQDVVDGVAKLLEEKEQGGGSAEASGVAEPAPKPASEDDPDRASA